MDLNSANIADGNAVRLTRAGMIACFVAASALLINALTLRDTSRPSTAPAESPAPSSTVH